MSIAVYRDALERLATDLARFDPDAPSLHYARGLPANAVRGNKTRLPISEILQAYLAGESVAAIADRFGCSEQYVYGLARETGVWRSYRSARTDDYRAMAAAYASGKTLLECAAEFKCSPVTVRNALRKAGVQPRPKGTRKKADTRIDTIMAMRADGNDMVQIGRALGISRERVRQIVVKAGLLEAFADKQFTPEQLAAFDAYRDGMSLSLAAAKAGASPETFKKWLARAGIEIRPSNKQKRAKQAIAQKAAQVARLYREGASSAAIAEQCGEAHPAAIYRHLARAGVTPNRKAVA